MNDRIFTQEYTALFNDFFLSAAMATFQFPDAVSTTKMVTVVDYQVIVYDPLGPGLQPTFTAATSAGHLVILTRNSAAITGSSSILTNSQYGGPVSRTCYVNNGPNVGPIYFAGANGDHEDHRRGADHLNHRKNNDSANIDTHIKICVLPQAGIAPVTSAAGARTKVKLIVKYRLMDYPTLA